MRERRRRRPASAARTPSTRRRAERVWARVQAPALAGERRRFRPASGWRAGPVAAGRRPRRLYALLGQREGFGAWDGASPSAASEPASPPPRDATRPTHEPRQASPVRAAAAAVSPRSPAAAPRQPAAAAARGASAAQAASGEQPAHQPAERPPCQLHSTESATPCTPKSPEAQVLRLRVAETHSALGRKVRRGPGAASPRHRGVVLAPEGGTRLCSGEAGASPDLPTPTPPLLRATPRCRPAARRPSHRDCGRRRAL